MLKCAVQAGAVYDPIEIAAGCGTRSKAPLYKVFALAAKCVALHGLSL